MKQNPPLRLPLTCLFLTLITGIVFANPSNCTATADTAAIAPYDASKFDPVPMPERLPIFTVKDERTSKQVFIKMKRKMMPPIDYFREGLQKSIEIKNVKIQDNGRELQFVINDFHVELSRKTNASQRDTGEIVSRIEVDVFIVAKDATTEIGNYNSMAFQEIEHLSSGVDTADIQYVFDESLHTLFKKIFSDRSFLDAINK